MTRIISLLLIAAALVVMSPASIQAQPSRQMPGVRPYLPGSPFPSLPEANSRTRAAASQVGLESTDFYGKKGYPRVLGDSVEAQSTGAGGAAAAGVGGGNTGNTGVQAAGSGGFQGNAGTQIGSGSLFGGSFIGNGSYQLGNGGGNFAGDNPIRAQGMTGGAFTGMVPKGFGFGGTPDFTRSFANSPLNGFTGK